SGRPGGAGARVDRRARRDRRPPDRSARPVRPHHRGLCPAISARPHPAAGGEAVNPGPDLLLTFDFPPMGGGIARWMAELALGYPPGALIVSTGSLPGGVESDSRFPNPVDRLALSAT